MIWHNRLGHPSALVLNKILNQVNDHITSRNVEFCNSCPVDKAHILFSRLSDFRAKNPLEIIYSNVWGPAPLLSNEGYRFYVLFIADYSHYTWIYHLKEKFEVKATFIHFHSMAERMFNKEIVCLRRDWGGEYKSLTPFLHQHALNFDIPIFMLITKMIEPR